MQTSKNLFVICVMALLVSAPNVPAGESEAQAKAREALRKKMSELDAQEKGAPATAPTAPTPATPAVVSPAPTSPAAAPAPLGVDDEATARAREAMRRKLQELEGPQKVARPAAPRHAAPAPVVQPQAPPPVAPAPAPVQASPVQPTYAPVRQAADDEATARAREAMRQKMNELNAQQRPAPAPATPASPPPEIVAAPVAQPQTPPIVAPAPAPVYAPPAPAGGSKRGGFGPRPEFQPIPAPASPISGSKESRLADLLRQYKADEITPEQYHKQRVKILAEP